MAGRPVGMLAFKCSPPSLSKYTKPYLWIGFCSLFQSCSLTDSLSYSKLLLFRQNGFKGFVFHIAMNLWVPSKSKGLSRLQVLQAKQCWDSDRGTCGHHNAPWRVTARRLSAPVTHRCDCHSQLWLWLCTQIFQAQIWAFWTPLFCKRRCIKIFVKSLSLYEICQHKPNFKWEVYPAIT